MEQAQGLDMGYLKSFRGRLRTRRWDRSSRSIFNMKLQGMCRFLCMSYHLPDIIKSIVILGRRSRQTNGEYGVTFCHLDEKRKNNNTRWHFFRILRSTLLSCLPVIARFERLKYQTRQISDSFVLCQIESEDHPTPTRS